MPNEKRRAADRNIAVELNGILHLLDKKSASSITAEDIAAISLTLRSARDVLLMPSSDPRIHAIETWLLVLVESAASKEVVGHSGASIYRTTFIDRQAFDLAFNRLQSLHFQGVAMRREHHASSQRTIDEE